MTHEAATERLRLTCVEATERLVDGLAAAGFHESLSHERTWVGLVSYCGAQGAGSRACVVVELFIPEGYPFRRPLVTPLPREAGEAWAGRLLHGYQEVTGSWHLEPNGQMCLYEPADYATLPWSEPTALLEHLTAWLEADRAGWPDDPPALDLDRYFARSPTVFLSDLPQLKERVGQVIALTRRGDAIYAGNPVLPHRGQKKRTVRRDRDQALVLDLGTLHQPVRDLDQVRLAAGDAAELLDRELRKGIRELVLLYDRGVEQGVLALTRTGPASNQVQAHLAAPSDVDALMLRAHPERRLLEQARVAVVGVGAIGSVLADLLHRSGVGHLHLIDGDRLLPGNLVRHLCGADQVGRPKVDAVREALKATRPGSPTEVTAEIGEVRDPKEALELLRSHDVVVDASADSTASRLVKEAADAGAGRAVSVAVLADGYAVRVDRWPVPPAGPLPSPDLPTLGPGAYEAGCSSPVSTTPPAAVWEAASIAARHVVEALLGENGSPGEDRVLPVRDSRRA